jgi:hypothetical protein
MWINKKLFIIIFLYTVYKTYLEISRESKVKESIIKDIKIKEINKEKDMIIKEKDKKIDDLKIKLEILQQKYDKIKCMFN